jgi:hypothetical protein
VSVARPEGVVFIFATLECRAPEWHLADGYATCCGGTKPSMDPERLRSVGHGFQLFAIVMRFVPVIIGLAIMVSGIIRADAALAVIGGLLAVGSLLFASIRLRTYRASERGTNKQPVG